MLKEDLLALIQAGVPDGAEVALLTQYETAETQIDVAHVKVSKKRKPNGRMYLAKRGEGTIYVLAPKAKLEKKVKL
jgi:hypothetical protein